MPEYIPAYIPPKRPTALNVPIIPTSTLFLVITSTLNATKTVCKHVTTRLGILLTDDPGRFVR